MFQNINPEFDESSNIDLKSNNKETILARIKNIFKIQNIVYYLICFGVSMIGFGEGISPFGLAILAATCGNKMPIGIVYIACILGTLVGHGTQGLLTFILTSLVFIVFSLIYKPKYENIVRNEKRKLGSHLIISTMLVQLFGLMFKTFYVYDFLTSILFTIVTYIFYKIFVNSVTVIKDYGEKTAFTIEEIIGASLLLSVSIAAVFNFTVLGFSVKNILCILIVLILGWKNGVLVGATGGITIGVVVGIIGKGDPFLIAIYALSGMIAGILNRFGKIGVIIGFFLGSIILTFTVSGGSAHFINFEEILIASMGLLLIPKSIEITITDLVGKTKLLPISKERMLEENLDTVQKLNSVSETISEISKSYEEAAATIAYEYELNKHDEINRESFIDQVLDGMENEKNNMLYEDIVNTDNGILEDIYKICTKKDEIHMQDIIEVFENHNSYIVGLDDSFIRETVENSIMQVVKIVNNANKVQKINVAWEKKNIADKKAVSMGLNGVSKVISNVADEINNKNINSFETEKEKIEILLLQKGIGIYDINIFKQNNGRIVVELYTKPKESIIDETEKIQKIEDILSKVFEQKMVLKNQKNNIESDETMILQEFVCEDKFTASVAISTNVKYGEEINGDSSLKLKLEDGKLLLALSDGMGSGKSAHKSSSSVIKMVKKLISTGFEKAVALQLINTSIAMKTQDETFATLDISILDLYTGNLEVLKNCACPTFIIRDNNVITINAISLPTGILNNIDSVVFDTDLKHGDAIVMCTDGIIDSNMEAINKENAFIQFLKNINTDSPKKIADIILKEAIDFNYGKAKDDMSVIVAKIK